MSAQDPRLRSLDELDLGDLDDFESDDLAAASSGEDDRNDYVENLWARYGFGASGHDKSAALVVALGLCQTFVDTFAGDGRRYRVTFDPGVSTAGTDLIGRVVVITPSPVYDEKITPARAGVILTGMSTHEVSHDRYGRSTALACRKVFGNKRAPNFLSNLLDDVRIERRFAAEYPGYKDVFAPMVEYVAKRGQAPTPTKEDMVNLAVAAVRYPGFVEWTEETSAERDWWQAWADRWAAEDAPRRHVEGVREGLRRVVVEQVKRRRKREREAKAVTPVLSRDARRIKEAIESLPPNVQRAMRLTAEGRTGAEVAATLGLSIDAAKALIRKGRKHMAGVS